MPIFLPMLLSAWAFVKAHWKEFSIVALVVLAFALGRFGAPKPEVKTVTQATAVDQTTAKQLADARAEVERLTGQVENLKRTTHERKTIVTRRDGTKVERDDITTDTEKHAERHENEQRETQTQVETTAAQSHTSTSTQTVTVKPADAPRAFVSLGVGIPVAFQAPVFGTPFVTLGGGYRFLGPLYAWGEGSADFPMLTGKEPLRLTLVGGLGVSF